MIKPFAGAFGFIFEFWFGKSISERDKGEPSSSNFHYRKVAVCLDIVIPPGLGRCRVGGCVLYIHYEWYVIHRTVWPVWK